MTFKEILEIILEYLKIFISWPAAFFIFSLIFIKKFNVSIKLFLENIASIKVGPFEASQKQGTSPEEITEQTIENSQEQENGTSDNNIQELEEKVELYEFAYLSYFLVPNTKLALLWFYNQASNSSTQLNYNNQYVLTGQIPNIASEKENIFNALLTHGLIEQNGILFKVSDKGIKFLKYIKVIL